METPTWAAALLTLNYSILVVLSRDVPKLDEGALLRSGVSLENIAKGLAWLFAFVAATWFINWTRRFTRSWYVVLRDALTATLVAASCSAAYVVMFGFPTGHPSIAIFAVVGQWVSVFVLLGGGD